MNYFTNKLRLMIYKRTAISFTHLSFILIFAIPMAAWTTIFIQGDTGFLDLFISQTWSNASRFASNMAGVNHTETPAFLILGRWIDTGILAYETLCMSIIAIFISGLLAITTMLPAARNISIGQSSSVSGAISYYAVRLSYAFSRAVPELIWALIIVFFLSPGVLAGALALALHNFGIIGRLTAETIENIDPKPIEALKSSGASINQIFFYGILPQTLPQFLTYSLYRWEVIIRTTVVIGFVGAGGLGKEFILRLNWFHYTDVSLIIVWYVILVTSVDIISSCLRKLARFE